MTRESSPKVAFITARLDEEERLALAASEEDWTNEYEEFQSRGGADFDHILRHSPSHALRKVAALRKLLDAHLGYYGAMDDEHLPVPTLTILAAIWDDHEDYPALVGTVTS